MAEKALFTENLVDTEDIRGGSVCVGVGGGGGNLNKA